MASTDVDDILEEECEGEEEDEEMEDQGDIFNMLTSIFATEEGDTVATALVGVRDAIETHNKLMVKLILAIRSVKAE